MRERWLQEFIVTFDEVEELTARLHSEGREGPAKPHRVEPVDTMGALMSVDGHDANWPEQAGRQ